MTQVDHLLASRPGIDGGTFMLLHKNGLLVDMHLTDHQQRMTHVASTPFRPVRFPAFVQWVTDEESA